VRRALLALALLAACSIERRPPSLMVRRGERPDPIHRAVLLPSECASQTCKGLDAIVAAELAFRGVDIVDLDRIAGLERARTEVDITTSHATNGRAPATQAARRVEVHGPLLSDVDVWTLRDQLTALGVDGVVRVRTAAVEASPARVMVLVRVTRARDASLVWSSVCEIEVSALATEARRADQALRCALKGAFP